MVNKDNLPCRGVAYSTKNKSHVLNVPARNMSALTDEPDHFVKWLERQTEFQGRAALQHEFVPRWAFGSYLEDLFSTHGANARRKGIQLEMLHDEAMDIHQEHGKLNVHLAEGELIRADQVVLTMGNQKPAPLKVTGLDLNDPRYVGNPRCDWEGQLLESDKTVVLAGTGLTMVDVFLSLMDRGWRGKVYAISPHGLLPLTHFKAQDCSGLVEATAGVSSLRLLFSVFKYNYRLCRTQGIDPAMLVDKLRAITPHAWHSWSVTGKTPVSAAFESSMEFSAAPRWQPRRANG